MLGNGGSKTAKGSRHSSELHPILHLSIAFIEAGHSFSVQQASDAVLLRGSGDSIKDVKETSSPPSDHVILDHFMLRLTSHIFTSYILIYITYYESSLNVFLQIKYIEPDSR